MIRRILSRVLIDAHTGCWLWQGSLQSAGYGNISRDGRNVLVHVVMYELVVGPVPEGMELDHVRTRGCLHKHCCNPAHLEPVTHAENIRRGASATATHCKRGHEFDAANTQRSHGRRQCRACHNERQNEARRARRATS